MKCQSQFSGKNKKNISNLLSAEFAQREEKVNGCNSFGLGIWFVSFQCNNSEQASSPVLNTVG